MTRLFAVELGPEGLGRPIRHRYRAHTLRTAKHTAGEQWQNPHHYRKSGRIPGVDQVPSDCRSHMSQTQHVHVKPVRMQNNKLLAQLHALWYSGMVKKRKTEGSPSASSSKKRKTPTPTAGVSASLDDVLQMYAYPILGSNTKYVQGMLQVSWRRHLMNSCEP